MVSLFLCVFICTRRVSVLIHSRICVLSSSSAFTCLYNFVSFLLWPGRYLYKSLPILFLIWRHWLKNKRTKERRSTSYPRWHSFVNHYLKMKMLKKKTGRWRETGGVTRKRKSQSSFKRCTIPNRFKSEFIVLLSNVLWELSWTRLDRMSQIFTSRAGYHAIFLDAMPISILWVRYQFQNNTFLATSLKKSNNTLLLQRNSFIFFILRFKSGFPPNSVCCIHSIHIIHPNEVELDFRLLCGC